MIDEMTVTIDRPNVRVRGIGGGNGAGGTHVARVDYTDPKEPVAKAACGQELRRFVVGDPADSVTCARCERTRRELFAAVEAVLKGGTR